MAPEEAEGEALAAIKSIDSKEKLRAYLISQGDYPLPPSSLLKLVSVAHGLGIHCKESIEWIDEGLYFAQRLSGTDQGGIVSKWEFAFHRVRGELLLLVPESDKPAQPNKETLSSDKPKSSREQRQQLAFNALLNDKSLSLPKAIENAGLQWAKAEESAIRRLAVTPEQKEKLKRRR